MANRARVRRKRRAVGPRECHERRRPLCDARGPRSSPRQWEVLTRLLQGERVPRIAEELFLSQSTVRNHLADMFKKMGVHSQEELLDLFRANKAD